MPFIIKARANAVDETAVCAHEATRPATIRSQAGDGTVSAALFSGGLGTASA